MKFAENKTNSFPLLERERARRWLQVAYIVSGNANVGDATAARQPQTGKYGNAIKSATARRHNTEIRNYLRSRWTASDAAVTRGSGERALSATQEIIPQSDVNDKTYGSRCITHLLNKHLHMYVTR